MESGFPQTIGKLRKNAFEEIWIALNEWNGKQLIDIRVYARGREGIQPTPKGLSLPIDLYDELQSAVLKFEKCIDSESPVVCFKKRKNEEVRISRGEFKGHQLINIRIFYSDEDGEMRATRKGVTFDLNLFSEFRRAIMAIEPIIA